MCSMYNKKSLTLQFTSVSNSFITTILLHHLSFLRARTVFFLAISVNSLSALIRQLFQRQKYLRPPNPRQASAHNCCVSRIFRQYISEVGLLEIQFYNQHILILLSYFKAFYGFLYPSICILFHMIILPFFFLCEKQQLLLKLLDQNYNIVTLTAFCISIPIFGNVALFFFSRYKDLC